LQTKCLSITTASVDKKESDCHAIADRLYVATHPTPGKVYGRLKGKQVIIFKF